MVVLVLTAVVAAGALVLLAELVSVRAADAGRAGSAVRRGAEMDDGALPLVADRGARFGDATRAERSATHRRLRVVPQVATASPDTASPATTGPATGHRAA